MEKIEESSEEVKKPENSHEKVEGNDIQTEISFRNTRNNFSIAIFKIWTTPMGVAWLSTLNLIQLKKHDFMKREGLKCLKQSETHFFTNLA